MVKERLAFSQGTDVFRAYEALTRAGVSFSALDTGCHGVGYSSLSNGSISGAGDKVLSSCEVWNGLAEKANTLQSTVTSLFGEAPTWILPSKSTDKTLQSQLQNLDKEIARLRKHYHGKKNEDLKVAKGLYEFVVSISGLAITSVDDVSENSASGVLARTQANCSEYFSLFRAVFARAGFTVRPVYVFESATGDKTAHIATAFEYGGKTYLMDPFYNGFDTAHRRWAFLSLRENWAWHFNNQALMEGKAGHVQAAQKLFNRASEMDPNNPWIPNNLGLVLEDAGKKDEAKAAYQKSIGVDSQFIEPFVNMGALYLKEGKWKEALVPLKQGYAAQPKDERILYNLASAHFQLAEYQKSLLFMDQAIQINSKNADYFVMRGDVFLKLGRNQEAQKDRAQALQFQGSDSE